MRWNFLCKTDEPELKLCLFESVKLINKEDWDEVVKHSANIYLTVDYLAALEESMNGMMGFRYIQLYNDSLKPVAVGYFQLLNFRDKGYNYHDILCKVGDRIKNKLLEKCICLRRKRICPYCGNYPGGCFEIIILCNE
jgi:hypothetical protein